MLGGFFEKLKSGLTKTRDTLTDKMNEVFNLAVTIDEDLYEELEEILITSDIGVDTSLEKLRKVIRDEKINNPKDIRPCLKKVIAEIIDDEKQEEEYPKVLLIIGVNGVDKTTSIGKIAAQYKNQGRKVILAAGDTFRAGAIDQLEVWANRAGVDIIKHNEGADPGAVVFDAINSFKAKKSDVLICDTAGRLHNKKNLMNELGKINRIIDKEFPGSQKETLLVLDGNTGQNAVVQAKQFMEICNIDGIILTKLDGTAKGGVVISIRKELGIPVKYIGVGEGIEDLQKFNAELFTDALF